MQTFGNWNTRYKRYTQASGLQFSLHKTEKLLKSFAIIAPPIQV